ncbi:sigma-70 family RNA polymerase sigma factor [Bradyrhizobium genosp. L]|uniref:sigma-70 family RNA polymerase sigma factor n=1 Tax=Bradyrhizobium genosp. L TaxID=83637 RepID=UPI0018A30482|nr:sigma-70 family RNA polymerase sigma factor [Bradyrhizobium genosp. L]QPF81648.1 sigma-70 family RNA polymerase sigma factor [Bradyrhizobium genosp. L]
MTLLPNDPFELGLLRAIPMLRRFALALTRNTDRAEDLVQDTLLRALDHRAKFTPGTNLDAWLTTICRNTWYHQRRKGWREIPDADGLIAANRTASDDPQAVLEAKQGLDAFHALPDAWRHPMQLHADGMEVTAIAALVGVPDGTIKSRMNRGRAALRAATAAEVR